MEFSKYISTFPTGMSFFNSWNSFLPKGISHLWKPPDTEDQASRPLAPWSHPCSQLKSLRDHLIWACNSSYEKLICSGKAKHRAHLSQSILVTPVLCISHDSRCTAQVTTSLSGQQSSWGQNLYLSHFCQFRHTHFSEALWALGTCEKNEDPP